MPMVAEGEEHPAVVEHHGGGGDREGLEHGQDGGDDLDLAVVLRAEDVRVALDELAVAPFWARSRANRADVEA